MRCSDCFAEMKQGPDGLFCDACGTVLAPVNEDAEVRQIPENGKWLSGSMKWLIGASLIAVVMAGGALFGPALFGDWIAPRLGAMTSDPAPVEQIILGDEARLVSGTLVLNESPGAVQLFADQTCQAVPASGAVTNRIEWIGFDGEKVASVSPQIPSNWRLDQICRDEAGAIIASAKLTDGVAISAISADGMLEWTRLLSVSVSTDQASQLSLIGGQILIVTPASVPGRFTISSFDKGGERLWQRELSGLVAGMQPYLSTGDMGDIAIAWNSVDDAAVISARVMTLTPQNLVNFDQTFAKRIVPIAALISDDVARTLLIEGQDGLSAQLISSDGRLLWRRWLDADASPVGVIQYGQESLVAGQRGQDLVFWRVRDDGTRTNPVSVSLEIAPVSAKLVSINDLRAAVYLEAEDGARSQIVLNLEQLSTAGGLDGDIETRPRPLPAVDELQSPQTVPPEPIEEEAEAPLVIDSTPEIERPAPQQVAAAPAQADPILDEQTDARPVTPPREIAEIVAAPIETGPEPTEASCMFTCVDAQNADRTYPIMQIRQLNPGETTDALSQRLGETHDQLCRLSGGQTVLESVPECAAR